MSAIGKLLDRFGGRATRPLSIIGASGQLGYGVPQASFENALTRNPDVIGADMGSTDIGPYYLGAGELATSDTQTRRDLHRLLAGARQLDVPLLIGSAGSAGAKPHLDKTLAMVRDIARTEGLHFRMAVIRSDMPRELVKAAIRAGRIRGMGAALPDLTEAEVDGMSQLVGQAGMEAFVRALQQDVDVVIAGRSCDTGIFSSIPSMLGYPMGPVMHMAKIVECASLCCLPGGRDSILAVLEGDGFILESMNPDRRATPMSVSAHSLYEQGDPNTIAEPAGTAFVDSAEYSAVDDRRTRVKGARWRPSDRPTVKLEGATFVGERAVMVAGSADPRFIGRIKENTAEVAKLVADLVCDSGAKPDYDLTFRIYGLDGVYPWPQAPATPPREIFVMAECIAPTRERAMQVAKSTKQYLMHHGFPGRLSTSGNMAFPFTPPELLAGAAYRFSAYHLMEVDDLPSLFPIEVETL